jgi:hypothetical protein
MGKAVTVFSFSLQFTVIGIQVAFKLINFNIDNLCRLPIIDY